MTYMYNNSQLCYKSARLISQSSFGLIFLLQLRIGAYNLDYSEIESPDCSIPSTDKLIKQ